MSESITVDRKFLFDIGGWKEMKEARMIHAAGKAHSVTFENGVLEGMVKQQGKNMKVRMEIQSRTDIINHCPCFRARRDGIICAHALAVGLEYAEPTVRSQKPTSSPEPAGGETAKEPAKALSPEWPSVVEVATEEAIPVFLHVVLAPNLTASWDKGSVTVGIELETGGERKLLKAFSGKGPFFLEPADVSLYRSLQRISPESVPGMLALPPVEFLRLLESLPGHPRMTFGKREPAHVSHLPRRLPLKRTGTLRFQVDWPDTGDPLVASRGGWLLTEENHFVPVAPGLPESLLSVLVAGLSPRQEDLRKSLLVLGQHFDLGGLKIQSLTPRIALEVEGSLNHLDAILAFHYKNECVAAGDHPSPPETAEEPILVPDTQFEERAIARLKSFGFDGPSKGGRFVLKEKSAILQFLAHGYYRLNREWGITTGERFEHAASQVEPVTGEMNFRGSGENWFSVEVGFGTASGEKIPRQEIQRLLQMGQRSKKLSTGKIAVFDEGTLEEFSEVITDCDPEQLQPGTYRVNVAQADYLRESAEDLAFSWKGQLPWEDSGSPVSLKPTPPNLGALLRPYQLTGVEWMRTLARRHMGGVLADDMGLGKTVQALTFLQSAGGPSLVVCPSSLVSNWVSEASKFTPQLKVAAIEGPDRFAVLDANEDADILVTSYALLRRDEELYLDRKFKTIILDEAQHIKNPDAKVSKIAHALNAEFRFALTGTPIENSVRDLWSIVRFSFPGYLGKRKDFAERFEKPLTGKKDAPETRERLSRRLRPVILRRLKADVAPELPEKIEQVIYCDLKPAQREAYEKILRESRELLFDAEGGRKRMLALTALLRLRQACCDLRLLGLSDIQADEASIKSDALNELLNNAIEGGHRILVFSQFVEMLQLIVAALAEKGLGFCYLDGSTRNRGDVVKRFQENDEIPVFLISLKAGGVGLNLTGADTVIHVDPWWNPAVEAQATDRAHRIGQTRTVTSYKLITRGTVEEKILSLQNRKRDMTESLLHAGGDASLSEEELLDLIQ